MLFVAHGTLPDVLDAAETIRDTERRQARHMHEGTSLRDQMQFTAYLRRRRDDPSYSFRDHLQAMKGAIEV